MAALLPAHDVSYISPVTSGRGRCRGPLGACRRPGRAASSATLIYVVAVGSPRL